MSPAREVLRDPVLDYMENSAAYRAFKDQGLNHKMLGLNILTCSCTHTDAENTVA